MGDEIRVFSMYDVAGEMIEILIYWSLPGGCKS